MQTARIKLSGTEKTAIDRVCDKIKAISEKTGTSMKGPIPLPTKKLRVPVLKTPCGDGCGHGNATFDRFEMRIHRRLLDVAANERVLHQIMRIDVPSEVQISIEIKD